MKNETIKNQDWDKKSITTDGHGWTRILKRGADFSPLQLATALRARIIRMMTENRTFKRTKVRAPGRDVAARFLLRGATCALLLATAGCTLRQAYPETEIRGYINGQPFSVRAPKDANLTGFDAVATTNGEVHVHIDSLQASLNPTNLANAGNAQAAIVTATGAVINQAIQTAAGTALKAAQ